MQVYFNCWRHGKELRETILYMKPLMCCCNLTPLHCKQNEMGHSYVEEDKSIHGVHAVLCQKAPIRVVIKPIAVAVIERHYLKESVNQLIENSIIVATYRKRFELTLLFLIICT